MKKTWHAMLLYALVIMTMGSMIIFISSMISFHHCINSGYETPWYDGRWLQDPYTNLRVLMNPERTRHYITTNGAGTDIWVVKETTMDDHRFWTIKVKIPIK
jgi:hypothetical protein